MPSSPVVSCPGPLDFSCCPLNPCIYPQNAEFWQSRSVVCTPDAVDNARRWISGLKAGPGTSTLAALRLAFSDQTITCAVMLSDGCPTDAPPDAIYTEVAAIALTHQLRIETVSFNCDGEPLARAFLDELARRTGGNHRHVTTAAASALADERAATGDAACDCHDIALLESELAAARNIVAACVVARKERETAATASVVVEVQADTTEAAVKATPTNTSSALVSETQETDIDQEAFDTLITHMESRHLRVLEVFNTLDQDRSGAISKTKLIEGLHRLDVYPDEATIRALFRGADTNSDGHISYPELKAATERAIESRRHREVVLTATSSVSTEDRTVDITTCGLQPQSSDDGGEEPTAKYTNPGFAVRRTVKGLLSGAAQGVPSDLIDIFMKMDRLQEKSEEERGKVSHTAFCAVLADAGAAVTGANPADAVELELLFGEQLAARVDLTQFEAFFGAELPPLQPHTTLLDGADTGASPINDGEDLDCKQSIRVPRKSRLASSETEGGREHQTSGAAAISSSTRLKPTHMRRKIEAAKARLKIEVDRQAQDFLLLKEQARRAEAGPAKREAREKRDDDHAAQIRRAEEKKWSSDQKRLLDQRARVEKTFQTERAVTRQHEAALYKGNASEMKRRAAAAAAEVRATEMKSARDKAHRKMEIGRREAALDKFEEHEAREDQREQAAADAVHRRTRRLLESRTREETNQTKCDDARRNVEIARRKAHADGIENERQRQEAVADKRRAGEMSRRAIAASRVENDLEETRHLEQAAQKAKNNRAAAEAAEREAASRKKEREDDAAVRATAARLAREQSQKDQQWARIEGLVKGKHTKQQLLLSMGAERREREAARRTETTAHHITEHKKARLKEEGRRNEAEMKREAAHAAAAKKTATRLGISAEKPFITLNERVMTDPDQIDAEKRERNQREKHRLREALRNSGQSRWRAQETARDLERLYPC